MIRDATLDDLADIVTLGTMMREETQALRKGCLPYPEIEAERVAQTVQIAISNPNLFMAKVAEVGERVVGMMGATMSLWAFSSQPLAIENNIYVDPAFRGTRAGYYLMKAFEHWAMTNGAVYTKVGVYTGMEEVGAFYERLGYEFIGEDYIKCVQASRSH